jgi:hypothetical protein
MKTDFRFLQDAPAIRKKVEVQLGPFATFAERKVATALQKYIVPWSIAMFGISFPKTHTIETYKEMLVAIIDAEELMPGISPDCAKEAKLYPVAFGDLVKKVKFAAGMC